ncbi:tRNA lysidine(34) synthetase TilS [Candidatus Omnitrophota bacterium]
MPLAQKIKKIITSQTLLQKNDTVIIGVSGGADSICLLHILVQLRYELGITLLVAHFNHKLRKGSDADQKFVEQLAQKYSLGFVSSSWKHPQALPKSSIEEQARDKRLAFFTQVAKSTKAAALALAHNKNDCAETVLMRMIRGSGLEGMRAIRPQNIIGDLKIIRPLLDVSRADIEQYCRKNKCSYREDPTNKKTIFTRNKVRHKLLPALQKEYNPNIHNVLSNLANSCTVDYDYIRQNACKRFKKHLLPSKKNQLKFAQDALLKEHPALRRMIYRLSFKELKGNTNQLTLNHFLEIEDLLTHRPKGSIVHLPSKCSVKKCTKHLTFIFQS